MKKNQPPVRSEEIGPSRNSPADANLDSLSDEGSDLASKSNSL
jgi:hypothetical protein